MKQSADKRPIGASSGRAAPGSSRMRARKAPSRGKRRARARPERSAVLPRQPLPLDVAEIAREIGIPLQLWVGNCHGVATRFLKRFPIEGARIARGFWTGPAPKTGPFAGRPLSGHSWILLKDMRVLDPTRFGFEDREPYLYLGLADHYDEAGEMLRLDQPLPPPAPGEIALDVDARKVLLPLLLRPKTTKKVTRAELAWIANRPLIQLGDPAKVFATLARLGFGSFVPIDNWQRVMEPETLMARPGRHGWYTVPEAQVLGSPGEILALVFGRFLHPDCDARLLDWCEDSGWRIDELLGALDALESDARKGGLLDWMTDEECRCLAEAAGDVLGVGNANAVRLWVERQGIPVEALDQALRVLGARAGIDCGWL